MNNPESNGGPVLEKFLGEKAKRFGLDIKYINMLPLGAQQALNRLDKLGSATKDNKRVSMLDESLMSSAWVEHHPDMVMSALNCTKEELPTLQRDLILGGLLSDVGKVANPQMIWLYYSVNFDLEKVKVKKEKFLTKMFGEDGYQKMKKMSVLDWPYSVALDFHRELYYNGTESGASKWEDSRDSCDKFLREIGFNTEENTLHDVMTGAHLAVLSQLLQKWELEKDPAKAESKDNPEWTRAIFIAKNHHLSRGLINGLPNQTGQKYLETILPNYLENRASWLAAAQLEEILDMTWASVFRPPREGDTRGIDARLRVLDYLKLSEKKGKMNRAERAYIVYVVRGLGIGNKLKESVMEFLAV